MTLSPAQQYLQDFVQRAHSSNAASWPDDDKSLAAMEALYAKLDPTSQDAIVLCFALAKIHDDRGNVDRAFHLYSEGNRHHARGKIDTIDDARQTAALVRDIFSSDIPTALPGDSKPRPIFILGMPRSGTSLVEQILASHSEVHGGGELALLGQWCFGYLKLVKEHGAAVRLDNYLGQLRSHYLNGLSGLGGLSGKTVVTDKMPVNFFWIGFLLQALPDAVIIHTCRDPMATCWSNFKTPFAGRSNGFACDLAHIGEFYTLYMELMAFWKQLFPGRIYDLNYEALTRDQEGETRKLLAHCQLSWQESCLNFHLNPRKVHTASRYQVALPLYQGSSESWKPYERFLKPLRYTLGKPD